MLKRYGIIYKLTNKLDGRSYIGQTTLSFEERLKRHKRNKSRSYITAAIIKYDIHNFVNEELYTSFSKEDLDIAEQLFINLFQSLSNQNGYNLKLSGSQPRNNSEVLAKMAKNQIGRKHTNNKPVQFTNTKTNEVFIIRALEDIKDSKEFRIKGIRKVLAAGKNNYKQYRIEYVSKFYVNQSGSTDLKRSEHAQRLEGEPTKVDYNPSTSHRVPKLVIKKYLNEIIDMYKNQKLSSRQIAKKFNVDKGTVLRHLNANGVDTFQNSMFNPKRNVR